MTIWHRLLKKKVIFLQGFTSYDDLAISLLKANEGRVEVVIAKLLYYP